MSGTRRLVIERRRNQEVTQRALDFYSALSMMRRNGHFNTIEFTKIELALHRELGLKVWHPTVFEVREDEMPTDPQHRADHLKVLEIKQELEKLLV